MTTPEFREAKFFLSALEQGHASIADAYQAATTLDPVVVFLVLKFLRDKYPARHPSAQGVIERLLELSSTYPDLVRKSKQGEKDMVTEWFLETYSCADFFGDEDEFLKVVIDKLEG